MIEFKSNVRQTIANKPNAVTAFDLTGTAPSGFRTVIAAYANTKQLPYNATNGTDWESGIGTVSAGSPNTLVRTAVLESSNADAAVDFSAGANIDLFVEWSASIANRVASPGVVIVRNDGTTTQSFAALTFVKCSTALTTVVANQSNWWDTTNKKFVPTIAGIYQVTFGVQLDSMTDAKSGIAIIRKNNVDYAHLARGWMSATPGVLGISGSCLVSCNGVSDYIEAFVYQNDTVSRNSYAGAERTFFMATRVGDI